MSEKLKNIANFIFRIGISIALLWFLFSKIDLNQTIDVLKNADLKYIYIATAIFFVINFILLWRWYIFIKALELKVPFSVVARYFAIGLFGNLFLPSAIGGDIIKVVGLLRRTDQKPKVFASVLLDRLSGFAAIVIVTSFFYIFVAKQITDPILFYIIGLIALASMITAVVLFNEKVYSLCCSIFNILPKFKKALMNMHTDIGLLKNRSWEGIKGVLMSCFSQMTFGFGWHIIAKAFGEDIPVIQCIVLAPLTSIAAAFPSIGGLGVREAGSVYLFGLIGVDSEIAISISLINFFFMLVFGLLGGLIYVVTLSAGRVQHHSSDPSPK